MFYADVAAGCCQTWGAMETLITPASVDVVRDFVKEAICSQTLIPFHLAEFFTTFPKWLQEQTGSAKLGQEGFRNLLKRSFAIIEGECPGLRIRLRDNLYGIDLAISGTAEWADVLSYAHGTGAQEAARALSPPAAELLERAESGELTTQFRSELSVRHRIRLFGYFSSFAEIIEEISVKRGIVIKMEEEGEKYPPQKHRMKFIILSQHDPEAPPVGYNPIAPTVAGKLPPRRDFVRWFFQM